MKKTGVFSAMALFGLAIAYGQAIRDPAIPNPVRVSSRAQLVASLEQVSVRIGDPIKLHYRLKNVSSEVISPVVYSDWNDDCWLMVTDASGTELPRTKEGDRMRQRSTSHVGVVVDALSPGEDDGDHAIDATKHYQLDRPGNYFVRIARRIGVADRADPRLLSGDQKVASQIPIEEAVSDLIPFTIVP
jgi:hypothetical protein